MGFDLPPIKFKGDSLELARLMYSTLMRNIYLFEVKDAEAASRLIKGIAAANYSVPVEDLDEFIKLKEFSDNLSNDDDIKPLQLIDITELSLRYTGDGILGEGTLVHSTLAGLCPATGGTSGAA